jgi:hypothetical protein
VNSTKTKSDKKVSICNTVSNDNEVTGRDSTESELITLSKMIENQRHCYAISQQGAASMAAIASQHCPNFDSEHILWKAYLNAVTNMNNHLEDIKDLEAQALKISTGSTRKKLKLGNEGATDNSDNISHVYATPRSSLFSSTSFLDEDEVQNVDGEEEETSSIE